MSRSKKPRSRREAATSDVPPEEEVLDQEESPQEEEAPPAPPRRPKKRRGANLEVKASGDPEEVRDALGKMNPAPPPAVVAEMEEDPPEETGPSDDMIVRLLSNPRNKVIVFRTFPKRWNGAKCDTQVDPQGYRCPASFEDIKQDVFRRFGGKSFVAYIQPVTLSGHSRVLAAIPFENPDTEEPQFEMPTDPNQVVDPRLLPPAPDGGDPTMVVDEDPMAAMEQNLRTQMRIKSRQLQLAQLNQQLKEFESTKDEVAAAASSPEKSMEERIALMQMENKMDRQIDALRGAIEKLSREPFAVPPPTPPSKGTDDTLVRVLMQQSQAAENRFNSLMAQQTQLLMRMSQGGGGKGDFDADLERLAKFKAVFGQEDHRVKRLEAMIYDIAVERLTGGGNGDGGEPSDLRYAVDKLAPMVKSVVDKKLVDPGPPPPTNEQFQRAVHGEATRLVQDLVKKGFIVKVNPQNLPGPAPAHPQKIGAPAEKRPAPKPTEEKKPPEEKKPQEEDPRMNIPIPPGPASPAYDRKKSVDFVLDSILRDIDAGFPEESYVVGDALDRLDEEILDKLLEVSSGEELELVVGPHCSPEKIQSIKDRGKNPRVKTWLTRVITTIQDEYRRELEGAPAEEEK